MDNYLHKNIPKIRQNKQCNDSKCPISLLILDKTPNYNNKGKTDVNNITDKMDLRDIYI